MKVLVSDTSVLIDLDRGSLVEPTFRLPYEFTVPDVHWAHAAWRSDAIDRGNAGQQFEIPVPRFQPRAVASDAGRYRHVGRGVR